MAFIRRPQNSATKYTSAQAVRILVLLFDIVTVICFSVRSDVLHNWLSVMAILIVSLPWTLYVLLRALFTNLRLHSLYLIFCEFLCWASIFACTTITLLDAIIALWDATGVECQGQLDTQSDCTKAYDEKQNLRFVACAFAFLVVILHFVLFIGALRSGGYLRSAKDRISPRVPSFIKAFARHLIYRNGGQSNLLSIRIPLLSLELIEVILWVVLVALYHKWIPNLPGSGVFLIHQGQEPEPVPFSGFHTITIPMLALVIASFIWTSFIVFRPLIASSQLHIGFYIVLELLCSTVLLACGTVSCWWNDVLSLRYFGASNEICITLGPPISAKDYEGSIQCNPHVQTLRRLKFSALVFVYLVAILHFVLCLFACRVCYEERRDENHMYNIGSEVELPIVTAPGRDGLAMEQGMDANQEQASESVAAEWGK